MGKANNPEKRYRAHINCRRLSHRTSWISSLKKRGLAPKMELLLQVNCGDWHFWEQDMIALFRESGCDLVNLTDGGEGAEGMRHSEAAKQKMRSYRIGKTQSSETRRKISESSKTCKANLGRTLSPEWRANIGESCRKKMATPEIKRRQSEAQLGKKHSQEIKDKIRAARISYWAKKKAEKLVDNPS